MGMSVTKRAKTVDQPKGGYIKKIDFKETNLGKKEVDLKENVHPSLVGMAVDYLSRYLITKNSTDSFRICLYGADNLGMLETAFNLLSDIKDVDDVSVINAIKLSGFDVAARNSLTGYRPIEDINPDSDTIELVKKLTYRVLHFFNLYGPIVKSGFVFKGGYTKIITSGDADYLTEDTIRDLKTIKGHFNKEHTMQILLYRRMGLKSDPDNFKNVKYLGIYNPRKDIVYQFDVNQLDPDFLKFVDKDIIGYNDLVTV